MTSPVPPSLDRFGDELHKAVRHELRSGNQSVAARVMRRPRILAGSALGLAGIATTAVLALGASTAAPAFAVTQQTDGTVLVSVNLSETNTPWVQGANDKLASMGINEQILLNASDQSDPSSPATSPVSCTPVTGASAPTGPPIKVQVTGQVPTGLPGAGSTSIYGCGYLNSTAANTSTTTANN
jgi:hypothetical protein